MTCPSVQFTHGKQPSMSSAGSSPLPLFSPVQRSSIDSTKTSPDMTADHLPAFARSNLVISDLADSAASLITHFWIGQDYSRTPSVPLSDEATPRRGSASSRFAHFINHVLRTTQVSSSVVTLALLFIDRLRRRVSIRGAPGSEFSISITALMLSNKLSDDHTYSAATWSSVAGIPLSDLVAAERELLHGLNFELHVKLEEFTSWQRLLDGLGQAQKETTHKRRKLQGDSSPTRPTAKRSSPTTAQGHQMFYPMPASQQFAIPPLRDSQFRQRKRSYPTSDSELPIPPAKRFASPLRNYTRPPLYAQETSVPPPAPSPLQVSAQGQPSDLLYLAAGRPSPQPLLPQKLYYYSLAAGQRNGIPHQFQPHFQGPLSLAIPDVRGTPTPTIRSTRAAYSMSPIEFARRTTYSHFTPPPSLLNQSFNQSNALSPLGLYAPAYPSCANAGQRGVAYVPAQTNTNLQSTLRNWQFPSMQPQHQPQQPLRPSLAPFSPLSIQ